MMKSNLPNEKSKIQKDYTNLNASCVTYFSGNWNNTSNAGTFHLNVNNATSNSNANITAHLLFSVINFYYRCSSLPWHLPKHKKLQICIGSFES